MSQHTPGPWVYSPGTLKHYVASKCGDLRLSLQELHWRDGHEVPAEANARLIAAAPDLLQACKAALEWVKNGQFDDIDATCDVIDAAIAKAEGRSA